MSNSVSDELMTTREAAALLGVGTTSIKRWADSGLLTCVKTPGGHRRFPRSSVEALLGQAVASQASHTGRVSDWMTLLLGRGDGESVVDALMAEHRERGTWAAVGDALGAVLDEIGRAWARGAITVIEEHVATERLQRGLARCSESLALSDDAPGAFLLTAEGDDHEVGLSLIELCLRENGWRPTWAGMRTPVYFACEFLATCDDELVAVSASQNSRDAAQLADQCQRLEAVCRDRGLRLVLGGAGLWPEEPAYAARVRTCAELHELLQPGQLAAVASEG